MKCFSRRVRQTLTAGKLPRTPADLGRHAAATVARRAVEAVVRRGRLVDFPEPKRGVLYEDSSKLLQRPFKARELRSCAGPRHA